MLTGFDDDPGNGVFNRTAAREGPEGGATSEITDDPAFTAPLREDPELHLAEDDLGRVRDRPKAVWMRPRKPPRLYLLPSLRPDRRGMSHQRFWSRRSGQALS